MTLLVLWYRQIWLLLLFYYFTTMKGNRPAVKWEWIKRNTSYISKSEDQITIRFRMGHDTSSKHHNMSCNKIPAADVNTPKGRTQDDVFLDAKEFENSSNSLSDKTGKCR